MTVRIAIEDLPPEARRAIERGDSVEVERDGEIVGRLEPDFTPASGWERFLEIRQCRKYCYTSALSVIKSNYISTWRF